MKSSDDLPPCATSYLSGVEDGFSLGLFAGFIATLLLMLLLAAMIGCSTTAPTLTTGDPEVWQPAAPSQPVEAY